MKTTLKEIRKAGPCGMRLQDGERVGYLKLRHSLCSGYGDTTPISIVTIMDSNGLDDALWCLRAVKGHQREMRLYAVWCARQVERMMTDKRSVDALEVARRHAEGEATDDELTAAWDAAWAAARDTAWDAAGAAAWAATRDAQATELRRVCECINAGVDPYAAKESA